MHLENAFPPVIHSVLSRLTCVHCIMCVIQAENTKILKYSYVDSTINESHFNHQSVLVDGTHITCLAETFRGWFAKGLTAPMMQELAHSSYSDWLTLTIWTCACAPVLFKRVVMCVANRMFEFSNYSVQKPQMEKHFLSFFDAP